MGIPFPPENYALVVKMLKEHGLPTKKAEG